MSMDKTLRQIADEHGVTKQAVRKHLDSLSKGSYYVGDNKTIFVTTKGQKELENKLKHRVVTLTPTVDTNLVETLKQQIIELQKDKAFLQSQIELKDEQLRAQAQAYNDVKLLLESKNFAIEEKPKKLRIFRKWGT